MRSRELVSVPDSPRRLPMPIRVVDDLCCKDTLQTSAKVHGVTRLPQQTDTEIPPSGDSRPSIAERVHIGPGLLRIENALTTKSMPTSWPINNNQWL